MRAVGPVGDEQAHAVAREPARLGRLVGLDERRQLERAHARHPGELASAVGAARQVALDQRQQAGNALLGRRPVGDVLAGERVLLHPRAHVARVDRVRAQAGVLGCEDRRQVGQRGLGRAVAAPGLVRLDGRIRAEVDDARVGGEARQRELDERERSEHVHLVDLAQRVEVVVARAAAAASGRARWRC